MVNKKKFVNPLMGRTEKWAEEWALKNGFSLRVTQRDDKFFICTRDFRTDRVNIKVKNGKVFETDIG
jgi:hypothetical protein